MKYAAEIDSGAMLYIPSFINISSAIQKLTGGGYTDTQRAWWSQKPILFFQNKESGIKSKQEGMNMVRLMEIY
jgi:hypothetical protein